MVITYNINFYRTGADRHNDISMSFLLLVAERKMQFKMLIVFCLFLWRLQSQFRS